MTKPGTEHADAIQNLYSFFGIYPTIDDKVIYVHEM